MVELKWVEHEAQSYRVHSLQAGSRTLVTVTQAHVGWEWIGWPALRVVHATSDGGEIRFSDLDTAQRVAEAVARTLLAVARDLSVPTNELAEDGGSER